VACIGRDVNNDITKEPITMFQTYPAHPHADQQTAQLRSANTRRSTPAAVTGARVIVIGQGALLMAAGGLLVSANDPSFPAALAVVSIIEGALRIVVGLRLRRGARVARRIALVLGALGIAVGLPAGGIGLIGAALSVALVSCLINEEAKAFFAAA
jgi:hypothetical protein